MTSFLFNKIMHDILWCTLWTTPKTQQHFQPGKISVFGAWGRDKLTAAPTTWLLMKLSSGPRPSSVNPQTILSQKTFCIINQTWYWVTWILFTPARPRSWPGMQPWHWSRCRKMALGSDSWQTDRLIESAEKNWRKFSRAAAAAPLGISAAKYFHDSIEIFLRFITVSMSKRRVASWNNY